MGLGILCPGQGAQSAAMLDILAGGDRAEATLDLAAATLGVHPRELVGGPPERLFENAIAQPLVCAVTLAAWAELAPRLPAPLVLAGYSVGELAAHACAGTLEPEALFPLARRRAEGMDGACERPNGLVAVRGIPVADLESLCARHGVWMAIINGPDRAVVGGLADPLAAFGHRAQALGGSLTPLAVSVASHTPLMTPALGAFGAILAGTPMARPLVPVLAGIDGSAVLSAERAREVLLRQLDRPIRWWDCLRALQERGCTVLLELGPGSTLSRMATELFPGLEARSVADFKTLDGVLRWVEGRL
ncbi:MAG: malonate decarboxylase subunit epsilon [Geothrix sp.]|nr:malonate decarboxylase subunit epsilon [Geothrix sp.]